MSEDLLTAKQIRAARHGVGQPLNALILQADGLNRRLKSDDKEVSELLEGLLRSTEQLQSLLASVFDAMDVQLTIAKPVSRPFAVVPFLRELAAEVEREGGTATVRPAQSCLANSDADLVGMILRNLIRELREHTTRGRVVLTSRVCGETVLILVSGDEDRLCRNEDPEAFEAIAAGVDGGASPKEGLGMGLAVARYAAKILGLELVVHVQNSEGSVFALRVPIVPNSADDALIPSDQPAL